MIPLKNRSTCSSKDISQLYQTCHFHWKGQCTTEIPFWNTPYDRASLAENTCQAQFDKMPYLPQKVVHVLLWKWAWRQLWYWPPRLCNDMTTRITTALNSNFCWLLIYRVLIAREEICWYHVIIGINHAWVCVTDINCLVWCLPSVWSLATLRSWCQQ